MPNLDGVTIGVPVFNESPFIDATILSAVKQCEVLLVSDNDSLDDTYVKCKNLANLYSNVEVIRQPHNIGALANFKILLDKAHTPYFMWLGGHDLLSENYVECMKSQLDNNTDAVLAYGVSHHIDKNGKKTCDYKYDYACLLSDDDPAVRLMAIIRKLSDCSLVHGLFRTTELKKAWCDTPYIGGDHVLLARAVLIGKFVYSPDKEYIRRDPHLEGKLEHQMIRISGSKVENQGNFYQSMQMALFKLASNYTGYKGISSIKFKVKSRYWLIHRFGIFGSSLYDKIIDLIVLVCGGVIWQVLKLTKK
jgi:glycosyltransferase involved in cell wall biosynthesis